MTIGFLQVETIYGSLSRSVIGNTSDSESEESRFEPWRDSCAVLKSVSCQPHKLDVSGSNPGCATKNLWSVGVAVISSDFQSEEHGFESRTDYLTSMIFHATI